MSRSARAHAVATTRLVPYFAALGLATATLACGAEPRVTRVYDGHIVEGRFVSPDGYAAFLRGALAEDAGDARGALAGYVMAAETDEDDPEVLTRIGETRCKIDLRDPEADKAFAAALKLDPTYAGALAGKARCAFARGNTEQAAQLAREAATRDPPNVGLAALAARFDATRNSPGGRERAVALTLEHGDSAAAWDALIAWGNARKDAELVARGLEGLVHAAPTRSIEAEHGAVALLDGGQLALARHVAAAVADAPRELGVVGPRHETAARLAVDEALARGDGKTALARATRGHVPLAEVAARALLLDQRDLASTIASAVAKADPGASGAQMVRAALENGKGVNASAGAKDEPPELCVLVFAERLSATSGADVARGWLAKITRTPMAARDPLGVALLATLVQRGVVVAPADLPAAR